MISFKNDYSEGAHPEILAAFSRGNLDQEEGYGGDSHCQKAAGHIRRHLKCDRCGIYFLSGGTQTNLTVIAHLLKPYQAVISTRTGHIAVHETGAVEGTGHRIIEVEDADGKLTPEKIESVIKSHTNHHMAMPKLVYLSNITETGTVYQKAELQAIYEICRENGLILYIDGARLGTACTSSSNDIELSDYPSLCDVFYIGGTKNGALFGEAVVFFDRKLEEGFEYTRKNRGALLAKGRALGLQFEALFEGDLFFEIGRQANERAEYLEKELKKAGFSFHHPTYANMRFLTLSGALYEKMSKKYGLYLSQVTENGDYVLRMVTSWATKKENIDLFVSDLTVQKTALTQKKSPC